MKEIPFRRIELAEAQAFFSELDKEADKALDKLATIYKYGLKAIVSNDILEDIFHELLSLDSETALEFLKSVSNYEKPLKMFNASNNKIKVTFKETLKSVSTECPLCLDKRLRRSDCPAFSVELADTVYLLKCAPAMYTADHFVLSHADHLPIRNSGTEVLHMLSFLDVFPKTTIASNNGLERIGGSLPHHLHYQIVKIDLPLIEASTRTIYREADLTCSIVEWKVPTLAIRSSDIDEIVDLYSRIYRSYRSPEFEKLVNLENDTHDNAVDLVARREGSDYLLFVSFRSKHKKEGRYLYDTSMRRYCVKSSGIGVFEVAGLFVLDAKAYQDYLKIKGESSVPQAYKRFKKGKSSVEDYLAGECRKILGDVSIFKNSQKRDAFLKRLVASSIS